MSRSRTHGPDSRVLQSEIKRLKKQLKHLERREHTIEAKLCDSNEEPLLVEAEDSKCGACKEGTIKILDLGIKILETCDTCNFRRIIEEK